MNRIEYSELKLLGASDTVLKGYSSSDPFEIAEDSGIYHISGAIDYEASSSDDLISFLEDFFSDFFDDEEEAAE